MLLHAEHAAERCVGTSWKRNKSIGDTAAYVEVLNERTTRPALGLLYLVDVAARTAPNAEEES